MVVIGRNEAPRLAECLRSVSAAAPRCLYVDSGSTDGSPDVARAAGVPVHELDPGRPFSAARGRNEGFERLLAAHPEIAFVQFVDGDCRLEDGWLARAATLLENGERVGIVCGRLRERRPDASPYQRLLDIEWDQPVGDVVECGGIFAARVDAFRSVAGFDASQAAGEELDLCLRLAAGGWRVRRLPDAMAVHDAAIDDLAGWWRRAVRGGWADAALAFRHGRRAARPLRATLSGLAWGGVLPVALVASALWAPILAAALVALVTLQWLRLARGCRRRGRSAVDARSFASLILLGKLAECWGALRFARERIAG